MRHVKLGGLAVAAFAACCGQAFAQTDVIVGDLMDVSNYTTGGAVDGKRAYSVGTTSCNIGPQRLTWIDEGTSVLYPVISQNMFRLNNGRFEQVGQAWLKHGFCALNGNVCSNCPQQSNPACAYLMPGCSDPYGSGLNGDQGGLGPKHEVNAATGAFPANALVGASTGNGTLRGRLQVNDADLVIGGNTANALFFVSSIYIHPEDAQFNTDNNNSSYRRVNVAQPSKTISLVDTTRRQDPPIFAWRAYGGGIVNNQPVADPTVVLNPIDVPNDGRFWVGSKVIPLGGGQYRYEYAVMNLTSDRAADGFSIPLPPNAVVTNAGFKDVDYHSGELQRGDDWNIGVSSSAVTWTMPDLYADDRWENALRWDTMYNFWFECNVGSSGGQATLNLFKAGAVGEVSATAVIPSPTGVGQPFNNDCSAALPMSGTVTVDTVGATTDGPDACNQGGAGAQIVSDVWYTYSAQCAGDYTVAMCSASFDGKIAVYASCATTGTPLACSDNNEVCGNSTGASATWTATANTSYLIRVGSSPASPATGTGQLTIDTPNCNGIPNDDCSESRFLVDGVSITGTTVGSLPTSIASTCGPTTAADVWFAYRPNVTGFARFDTCGSNFDTILTAYDACGGVQVACNDDRSALTAPLCNVNAQGVNSSSLRFNMTAGQTYYIRLTGFSGSTGPYAMVVNGGQGALPPTNDMCLNRVAIGTGSYAFSNRSAGTEATVSPTFGQIFNDVWFNKPITQPGTMTVSVCDANFDTKIAVYNSGNCLDLESKLEGWSDNATCGSNGSSVTIPVTPGTYVVRVGGAAAGQMGNGNVNVTFTPSLVCDSIDFNNDGAQFDPTDIDAFLSVFSEGPCLPATATCNDIDFNNDGSLFDPRDIDAFLSVFSEGPCL